jgi:hypothetical protein
LAVKFETASCTLIKKFRCTQRSKLLYYNPARNLTEPENPWLLIPFINEWFNLIDLQKVKAEVEHLNPYQGLEIRWTYPEQPQKLQQSLYKPTLDTVDFDLWINQIIPRFEDLTVECHCQREFQKEARCQGHLASGNINEIIQNPIIRDRLLRGPNFRETTNDDFNMARQALDCSLRDLFDRKRERHAQKWIDRFLKTFERRAEELCNQELQGKICLKDLLFPAPGRIQDHQKELDAFLSKYVILHADKCRGNYMIVCKSLYIKQCVSSLQNAPKYSRLNITKNESLERLQQTISGLLHHSHLALMLEKGRLDLPYFYTLPKPHKNPVGWRPVAATHRSIFEIPQRVLTQALSLVMKTLRDFHAQEFRDTVIRRYWIVENSIDIILSLPKVLTSMYSSDIDSMYQKMNQSNVMDNTTEEIRRAATIIGADAFFVVVGDTCLGNKIDQVFLV